MELAFAILKPSAYAVHRLLVTDQYPVLTAQRSLLVAFCLLLTAYCLLLTAYCLLLAAYRSPLSPRITHNVMGYPSIWW